VEDAIGRLLGRTHKFVRMWCDRKLAPIDGSVTEWILLTHIAQAEAPGMSQTDVARFSDMSGPALVRHLDRLAEEGALVRTRDADDRRVMRITLTARGLARLDELRVVMDACDREMRAQLTKEEQRVLARALDKLFKLTFADHHAPRSSA
jgi:DNA-binding MarR family transcriptional regulator